ncbi:MAG: hypothetical protein ACE5H1_01635 [Thermodesulfobacteriota bacterium]
MSITPKDAVRVLNLALRNDPVAINRLFVNSSVRCNKELANQEAIQVYQEEDPEDPIYSIKILGIINGIFGIRNDGFGEILMYIKPGGEIEKFVTTEEHLTDWRYRY